MRLDSAKSGGFYRITAIDSPELTRKMGGYGIFSGSVVSKVNKGDLELATLKLYTEKGTRTLSGSIARHLCYKSSAGEKRSIYEQEPETEFKVVVPKIAAADASVVGIKGGSMVQVLKKLPHMEYVALVDQKIRCRLSEAHAACILGECQGEETQFSFAKRGAAFTVSTIVSMDTYSEIMKENGIKEGTVLTLEGIEAGRSVHLDDYPDMVLCTADGLRVFISSDTAKKIHAD